MPFIPYEILFALGLLLVLSLVAPLFSPFRRARRLLREEDETHEPTPKPLSVIITCHDCAAQLDDVIDAYLTQEYAPGFQLVIVIDDNDTASEQVLLRREADPHLYYTRLPMSSRYLSRKKLAITIGLRAAVHDWVVITSVYCRPQSKGWLAALARHIDDDAHCVIGLTPFDSDTRSYWRYYQLRSMLYCLNAAAHAHPYSTTHSLIALRKDDFFAQQGFAGNLEYQRAEFEFLVNKYATPTGTRLALDEPSRLCEATPTRKQWLYRHMHAYDARHSMQGHRRYMLPVVADLATLHIYNVVMLLATAAAVAFYLYQPTPAALIVLAAVPAMWIVSQAIRAAMTAPVLQHFECVGWAAAMWHEWFVSWHNLACRLHHRFADKYDFMTHKL